MNSFLLPLAIISLFFWLIILLLPWQPWRNRHILEKFVSLEAGGPDMGDLTVIIPARNEAAVIQTTLNGLAEQGHTLPVILVDDCSTDGTAGAARQVPGISLTIIQGQPLPAGWAGKLWALEQGLQQVRTPYTLLLDSDILLAPGVVAGLLQVAQLHKRALVSVMASLPMGGFWEKLLTPAFIYFFKMLYPFSLSNSPSPRCAAAAGGCILLETRLFNTIGGLASIQNALIDDCALAARVKQTGARLWIGQSHLVTCIRPYSGLGDIWNMVARSAYTQLRYSPLLLLLCTAALAALFLAPPFSLLASDPLPARIGVLAWGFMSLTYLPTLLFYQRSPLWVILFPLAGLLYLAMTWTSALRYYRGQRSRWKDRTYARENPNCLGDL